MARRREPPRRADGWLVSYGDLVTTLLCFFIILSTLAKDQTGVKLKAGLDSFRHRALLPGLAEVSPHTARPFQLGHVAPDPIPAHLAADDNDPPDEAQRVKKLVDLEAAYFEKFLGELKRQFQLERKPPVTGRAAIDLFHRLQPEPPYLPPKAAAIVHQVLPVLQRRDYRVSLVVWATMPSSSAWLRAASQARRLTEEVADAADLDADARARLVPLGQPWPWADRARPVFSLIITRVPSVK